MCMKRIHINLPERMITDLQEVAKRTELPVSELIRRAIDEFLRREGKK